MRKKASLVILLLVFSACATVEVGRPLDPAAFQKIEVGKTTEAQVIALLGPPQKKTVNADGSKIYGYTHVRSHAWAVPFYAKGTASGEKVIINFDPSGIVTSVDSVHLAP